MKRDSMERFSLLVNGVMDKPSCRLLLVNVSSSGSTAIEYGLIDAGNA
jgi:hypothetical protein